MDRHNEYNQLIELTLSGDKEAYSELYEKTINEVYKSVHFLIEEKANVDDVVQEIYIEVYKSLSKYDKERQFKPWLMGIVIRQIQAYRRKRWMSIRITKKAEKYGQVIETDFSNDVIDKLSNSQLNTLVNDLPYKLKQVVILHYLNDYTQEEISSILNIPLGTVKSRINSALKKLRRKEENHKIFIEKARNVV